MTELLARLAVAAAAVLWAASGLAQVEDPAPARSAAADQLPPECGNLYEFIYKVGPYDYRKLTRAQREIVEFAHFTPDVESLRAGTTGTVGVDLSYTLRAIPNHHRALEAMGRLYQKTPATKRPDGVPYSLNCWFLRAIAFAPDDARLRYIYSISLLRMGQPKAALDQLEFAGKEAGYSADVYYMMGMAHFDLKDYGKSFEFGKKAYDMGYPLPGLRDKLKRIGRWRES